MKNTRKKVLPLLLAGVLLLSAGAYGTRAYFTDSAEQEVGINLTLGDLEINSGNTFVWKYTPEKGNDLVMDTYDINDKLVVIDENNVTLAIPNHFSDAHDLASKIVVSNARPGDAFERSFSFTNTGSLTQKISINRAELVAIASAPYTVSITGISEGNNVSDGFILTPGKSATYTVKIAISGNDVENDFNNADVNKYLVEYFGEYLTVSATQPNANE